MGFHRIAGLYGCDPPIEDVRWTHTFVKYQVLSIRRPARIVSTSSRWVKRLRSRCSSGCWHQVNNRFSRQISYRACDPVAIRRVAGVPAIVDQQPWLAAAQTGDDVDPRWIA